MAFKYRGILAKARPHDPVPGLIATTRLRTAWIERHQVESLKRWRALYDAHGVEWGDESALLWRLVEAHVPGFRMQESSGPKTVWNVVTKAELRIAVDEYVADRTREGKPASISQACAVLAKRDPWASKLRKGKRPSEALRGHYNTADLIWVQIVRNARMSDLYDGKNVTVRTVDAFVKNPIQTTSHRKKSG